MKWLNNFKMRQKLIISFMCVAFLIGVVGIIGIRNMNKINSNEVLSYNRDLTGIKDMSEIKSNLIQINLNVNKILNEDNKANIQNLMNEIDKLKDEDDKLISDYEKIRTSDKDANMLVAFDNILRDYRSERSELFKDISSNNRADALMVSKELEAVSNKIVEKADEFVKYNESLALAANKANTSLYETTRLLDIIAIVFGFTLASLFGLAIASTISKQLEKVLNFAEAVSNGDLEHTIEIESKDEIGALAKALNRAAAVRKQYEEKLNNNYQELEASYEEITALESDLREKYQELESSFEEITALEEELRERYNEIAIREEELRKNYEWYKLVTEASYDVLWDWDIKKDLVSSSEKFYSLFGVAPGEYSISDWIECMHPEDVENIKAIVFGCWENKQDVFTIQYRVKTEDASYIWMLSSGKVLYDEKGQPYRAAGCIKNITDIMDYQEKLEHMAYHDNLTSLPNRQYMYRELNYENLVDNNDLSFHAAVLFIDIDNFKYINDTMGHSFGDNLIKLVGNRLSEIISSQDILVRLGGDEFVIFAKDITGKAYVEDMAKRILQDLNKPFEISNNNVKITVSLGISMLPEDGIGVDELLKKADIAMYKSKYLGKNSYTFFASNMNDEIIERMNIERFLRRALINEEFVLYYQPQVEVHSGQITGFEALIRWNNPELGFVSPDKFIPIAEENHMIIDIGYWVLETACKFIKTVHKEGNSDCCISVNVSVLQLMQSDFVDNVCDFIKEIELPPQLLELEITESVFIDSFEIIGKNIETLKNVGIRIALDDFGKGYSSLSYLKQLPINTLKIDKSFVDDINNEKDSSLVENIIVIGHKMNLDVVAEGVELIDQMHYLKQYQCDKIQGYLYSRPVCSQDALNLVMKNVIEV